MKPIVTVICETVGRHYHVSVDDIERRNRSHTVALARAIAIYVVRTKLHLSWPEIGREFGRDHTTAIWANRKVLRMLEDARVAAAVQAGERVAEEWRVEDA